MHNPKTFIFINNSITKKYI